jgi:hypothetical protein
MKFEEKNRETLKRSIDKLTAFEPPQLVWDNINEQLDKDVKEKALHEAIEALPSFNPPDQIWAGIEKELVTPSKPKVYWLSIRTLTAAASVALLLGIGAWYFMKEDPAKVEIVFSEVVVEDESIVEDWDEDEADFQAVLAMYQETNQNENNSGYQDLELELEELNMAKEEVKLAIETFGSDADLIKQLSEIERQRNEVVKEMATYI